MPRPERQTRGFTLFEVLAAALVLALVGTLLIGSMNTNLSHQSDTKLRLEAGRIADNALAELEATLFDGSAPAIGADETQQDDFTVRTKVLPFTSFFDAEEAPAPTPAEEGAAAGLGTMIAGEFPGLSSHLRTLHVVVLWGNPQAPESVVRTTVAFDHTAALEALENLQGGQGDDPS